MQAALLFLVLILESSHGAVVTVGTQQYTVRETAQLHMEAGVSDLKATDLKIYWGTIGPWMSGSAVVTSGTVIEIYLPRFSGGSNLFGAYRDSTEAIQFLNAGTSVSISDTIHKPWAPSASTSGLQSASNPGIAGCYGIVQDLSSNAFDLKQLKYNSFSMCYWDSQRETLRLYLSAAQTLTGVYINKVSLFQNYDTSGPQNGLGPLPPLGGIDEKWHELANIAFYQAGTTPGCVVPSTSMADFPSTPCSPTHLVYQVTFDKYRSVRFGTDLPAIPSRKGAGAVGTVAEPTFVYAAAAGNNNGAGSDVCITVTLISSATIYSESSTNPTSITIGGLQGSSTPTQTTYMFRNKCDCEADVQTKPMFPARFQSTGTTKTLYEASYDANAATLSFEMLPGQYLQAGEVLTFAFKLTTGTNEQASRDITVSLNGRRCLAFDFCVKGTASVPISISNLGFNNLNKILEVKPNSVGATLFQSSSDPGSQTNILVTLTPNFDIDSASYITINGLCGSPSKDAKIPVLSNRLSGGVPLTDKCSSANNPTEVDIGYLTGNSGQDYLNPTMDWSGSTLKITVNRLLPKRGTYTFAWSWQNSYTANAACSMTLTASKGGQALASESVTNLGNTVGKVDSPGFIKYKIGQTTTRPDVTNYICVTLRSNFLIATQPNGVGSNQLATITLSGLQGSQTKTQPILTDCPSFSWDTMTLSSPSSPKSAHFIDQVSNTGTLDRTSSWQGGSAILTVNQDSSTAVFSIPPQQDVKFALVLQNPTTSNACQQVTLDLSALGPDGISTVKQTVQMVQSSLDRALQDGEEDGDVCVLKTYPYSFLTRHIAQSSSVVLEANTLTISLRSNMLLGGNSFSPQITISGLTGFSNTEKPAISTTTSDYPFQYHSNIQDLIWTQSSGTLQIQLKAGVCEMPSKGSATLCIYPGWVYVMQFLFTNGGTEQPAPTISISAQFAQSKFANSLSMTYPLRSDHYPLYLTSKILNKYEIGQLNPAPSAVNPVCVTLRPSKTLGGQTQVTITGLTMFRNSGSTVPIVDEYGILVSDNLFATVGTSQTPNSASYDGSAIQFQLYTQAGSNPSLTKGQKYKVCFKMTNSNSGTKTCPQLSLVISSPNVPNGFSSSQTYVLKNEVTRMVEDYPNVQSGCAGYIAEREFIASSIRAGSNVTSTKTWVTMELQPNYNLNPGQTISIGPLSGYTTTGDVQCTVSRNGQFFTSVQSEHASIAFPAPMFSQTCKISSEGYIQVFYTSSILNAPVYNPFYDVSARRSQGLSSIQVLNGGSGYTASTTVIVCDLTPSNEFWTSAKSQCVTDGVFAADGSGAVATPVITGGAVTSITLNQAGSGYTHPPHIVIVGAGSGATAQAFLYDHSVYTVQFQLTNQGTATSAQAMSIVTGNSFVTSQIDGGLNPTKTSMVVSSGVSDVTFSITPQQNLYPGDVLTVNLPTYRATTGPIFGVTSSPNPAFTTFKTQLEWELNYNQEDRGRAFITDGWVADGNRYRSGDADVDGVFVLSPEDDGYTKNKNLCWSSVSCPWGLPDTDIQLGTASSTFSLQKKPSACTGGTFTVLTASQTTCISGTPFYHTGTFSLGHTQETCYSVPNGNLGSNIADNSKYVGMQIQCRNNAFTTPSSGSNVTSVRVKNGGLFTVQGSSSFAGQTFSFTPTQATAATGTLAYKVVGLEYVGGSTPALGDTIVFDSTYQVEAAEAFVQTEQATGFASYLHITKAGLYAGYPTASITGKNTILKVILTVASASLTAQGAGYTSIPTIVLSSYPTSSALITFTVLEYPVFDVSLTNPVKTVITQTVLDYNYQQQCLLFAEEFPTNFLSDCKMVAKENIGRYTGMTAMIGSNEYIIKQGAGGVYWVTDSSGNKPQSTDLANKPYTIYAQLQLYVAKGKWIRQGETISITIPGYRFKSIPADQNAYITSSTDSASKTIKERTRFQFGTPISHVNVKMTGSSLDRMLVFGGPLSGQCTIISSNIDQPQLDGSRPTVGVSDTTGKFVRPSNLGSGYLRPAVFTGSCTGGTTTNFLGIFTLPGQRTGIESIEIVHPGTKCANTKFVQIGSPSIDQVVDATTNTLLCPGSDLCTQATATVSTVGGSISAVTLTNPGAGYFFQPVVTFYSTASNMDPNCDAQVVVHLSHNFTSRISVTPNSELDMYTSARDQYDSLTGLHTSTYSSVSLHKMYSASTSTAEQATGYVSSIVITSLPSTSCTGPMTITSPSSGSTAQAQLQTTGTDITSIQVTDGGSGYVTAPTVGFPSGCTGGQAYAILAFNTTDVFVQETPSSSTGLQFASVSSTSKAPGFYKSMDSPVIAGFNQACNKSKGFQQTITYGRQSNTTNYGTSRVTSIPVPASTNGFVFGFTSISISKPSQTINDPMATATAVPTWSFPPAQSSLNQINNNIALLYKGLSSSNSLADCSNAVLIFNAPEQTGGATLQIQIGGVNAGIPTYSIYQQGTGYANIPSVVDIKFLDSTNTAYYYTKDYAILANKLINVNIPLNCRPSYFAFDTSSRSSTSIYTQFASLGSQLYGLTLDGALITNGGYGYSSGPVSATFACSGCSSAQCTYPDGTQISSLCTAVAITTTPTVSFSECIGNCLTQNTPVSAFFSPGNRDAFQVCSAFDAASGIYRTRKTLQMRVSSGTSQISGKKSLTAKRHKGFNGLKGSLIFKLTSSKTFTSTQLCEVPKVVVEAPQQPGGIQAEIALSYIDTQLDPYTRLASSSITASANGFVASTSPFEYHIEVVNAGSGYLYPPKVFVLPTGQSLCPPPTITAYVRNGQMASRVELIRTVPPPGSVKTTCSSKAYAVPVYCSSITSSCTSSTQTFLNPFPSCPSASTCTAAACKFDGTTSCSTNTCAQDNCPAYSPTLTSTTGAVLNDESLAMVGWNFKTGMPELLNSGFGFSYSGPNPVKLFFPSDAGDSFPCAEILVYLTEAVNAEAVEPGPLYWPGDLSLAQNSLRNNAGQVTKVDYLLRPGFSNGVYGVSTASVAVTTFQSIARRRSVSTGASLLTVASTVGFKVNDYIKIQNEILQVVGIPQKPNSLTVNRGVFNTTVAGTYPTGTIVRTFNPGSILVNTISAAETSFFVLNANKFNSGTYILVEREIMFITSAPQSASLPLTVVRGQGGTVAVSHLQGVPVGITALTLNLPLTLKTAINSATATFLVSDVSALFVGNYITVENEIMKITALNEVTNSLTVERGAVFTVATPHQQNTAFSLTNPAAIGTVIKRDAMLLNTKISTKTQTKFQAMDPVKGSQSNGFQAGDYIQVGSEMMLVSDVQSVRNEYLMQNVTVVRGQVNTQALSSVDAGMPVSYVFNPKYLMSAISSSATSFSVSDMNGIQAGNYLRLTNYDGSKEEVVKYLGNNQFARGAANTTAIPFIKNSTLQEVDKPTVVNFVNDSVKGQDFLSNETVIDLSAVTGIHVGDNVVLDAIAYNVTNVQSNKLSVWPLFSLQPVTKSHFARIGPGSTIYVVEDVRLLHSSSSNVFTLNSTVQGTYNVGDFVRVDSSTRETTKPYKMSAIISEIFQVTAVGMYTLTVDHAPSKVSVEFPTTVLYKYNKVGVLDVASFAPGEYVEIGNELDQVVAVGSHILTINRLSSSTYWSLHEGKDLVTLQSRTSFQRTTVAKKIYASNTTIVLNDASGFRINDFISVDGEAMQIKNLNGNNLQVTRGLQSTTPSEHAEGLTVRWLSTPAVSTSLTATAIARRSAHLRYVGTSAITLPASVTAKNVWAQLDQEIFFIPGAGDVQNRGMRGTAIAAHVTGTPYNFPNNLFSLQFDVITPSIKSSNINTVPVYAMNAAGVWTISGFSVLSKGSSVMSPPTLRLSMNRYLENGDGSNLPGVDSAYSTKNPYSFQVLTSQPFLQVDLQNQYTQKLIKSSVEYPEIYAPSQFTGDQLYFQDLMDGFDTSSESTLLTPSSNILNASSTEKYEPATPVYAMDSFGQLIGESPSQYQTVKIATYQQTITNRPAVLDSVWSSSPLLVIDSPAYQSVTMYLNDTIVGKFANGQRSAVMSSSTRMFVWKTDPRKLAVTTSSSSTSSTATTTTTTPSSSTNVGAIVGGVIGGVVGAALLGFLAYKFLTPAAVKAPAEEMVPVYLPQTYPVLPVEYGAAAPMPGSLPVTSPMPMPVNASPMYGHQPLAYGM
eukprot:477399-Hanusia_phi.AAC.2